MRYAAYESMVSWARGSVDANRLFTLLGVFARRGSDEPGAFLVELGALP
jgi:hypothetical protein